MSKDTEHNIAVIAQELQNIRQILYVFSKNWFDQNLPIGMINKAINEMEEEIICMDVKHGNYFDEDKYPNQEAA